jgi:hypothetical protein
MGDWVDEALRKYDDQRADKQAQDHRLRDNQQARERYGMTRWYEVKEAVNGKCKGSNLKAGSRSIRLTVENSIITELDVRADIDGNIRRLHASFEESTGKLSWSYCGKNRGGWTVEAAEDGNAQFAGGRGPLDAEWIADEMLAPLIDLG